MAVSIEEIRRMAALAHLRLAEAEAARMARDMSSILEYMAVLGAVDLDVEPPGGTLRGEDPAGPGDARSDGPDDPSTPPPLRPDTLARLPSEFAPDWRDSFFVVPRLPAVTGRAEGSNPSP